MRCASHPPVQREMVQRSPAGLKAGKYRTAAAAPSPDPFSATPLYAQDGGALVGGGRDGSRQLLQRRLTLTLFRRPRCARRMVDRSLEEVGIGQRRNAVAAPNPNPFHADRAARAGWWTARWRRWGLVSAGLLWRRPTLTPFTPTRPHAQDGGALAGGGGGGPARPPRPHRAHVGGRHRPGGGGRGAAGAGRGPARMRPADRAVRAAGLRAGDAQGAGAALERMGYGDLTHAAWHMVTWSSMRPPSGFLQAGVCQHCWGGWGTPLRDEALPLTGQSND